MAETDKKARLQKIEAASERLAERAKAVRPPPPGELNEDGKPGAAVNAETAKAVADAAEAEQVARWPDGERDADQAQ